VLQCASQLILPHGPDWLAGRTLIDQLFRRANTQEVGISDSQALFQAGNRRFVERNSSGALLAEHGSRGGRGGIGVEDEREAVRVDGGGEKRKSRPQDQVEEGRDVEKMPVGEREEE